MDEAIDERRLGELIVESEDLQSDAMKGARADLNAYVEAAHESRFESPAPTAGSRDVMALQTAAGIEVLAAQTYRTALTLPFIGGNRANRVLREFATRTMRQHEDHLVGFNSAVARLGGAEQHRPNPKYARVVNKAVPKIKSPADVVALALVLEDVAAATYVKDTGLVSTAELRTLFLGVAGVEAQHKAVLLAVAALLKGHDGALITLPPDAAKLPQSAGAVGSPDAFYSSLSAVPVSAGAVT